MSQIIHFRLTSAYASLPIYCKETVALPFLPYLRTVFLPIFNSWSLQIPIFVINQVQRLSQRKHRSKNLT